MSNNNSDHEIPLELSQSLRNEGIVKKFVKDIKNNCVKLELNHKYDQININVPIGLIKSKKDGWILFTDKFRKDMRDFKIDPKHNLQVYSVLNNNSDLINKNDSKGDDDNYNYTDNGNEEENKQPKKRNITTFKYSKMEKVIFMNQYLLKTDYQFLSSIIIN